MSSLKPTTVKYVDNFAPLNSQDVAACRAVTFQDGVLRAMPDLTAVTVYSNYAGFFGVSSKYLFTYMTNGMVIYNHSKAYFPVFIDANKPRTMSCYCYYREKFYFSYEDKPSYKLEPMRYEQTSDSKFAAMCFVNDRFLGLTDGLNLYLGENGEDKLNLEDEQKPVPYLTLPTKCSAMVSLGLNDVYLLGKTCYKLTVSADFSDVKLKRLATGLTEVNKWSTQVLGDKIVFATDGGLYVIRKDKVSRILTDFDAVVNQKYSSCRASALDGKYVLSFPQRFKQRNIAYLLDVDKQQCVGVLHEGVVQVQEHYNNVNCITDDGSLNQYTSLSYATATYLKSNVDFGTPARKFLRRLNIRTKNAITVYVTDEYGEKAYSVSGSDAVQSIPVVASGVNFTYRIVSADNKQLVVDKFELVAEIYKEARNGN